jgi:NAD+ synthase (glutamine-hydrolysing)
MSEDLQNHKATDESFGFVRIGTAVPRVQVADCAYNADRIIELIKASAAANISILVFPELSITAYTCADLFQQSSLHKAAEEALARIVQASGGPGLVFVGMPVKADDQLFNCAIAISSGKILGVIPKSYNPNYKEFYENRWFSPADNAQFNELQLLNQKVPFGTDLIFEASDCKRLLVGAEICEDLWVPVPPSSYQALAGATLLVNLSASNELIGKVGYRRQLVSNQSARCIAGYAYSSCGTGESSTDLLFSGHCLIAENGVIITENERFERKAVLKYTDLDLEKLELDRLRANTFGQNKHSSEHKPFRRIPFAAGSYKAPEKLAREVDAHPFVPRGKDQLADRCNEIFHIQVSALAKRLESLSNDPGKLRPVIGVSGGLDSTLSLLVLCKAMDLLGAPRQNIIAFTLPGFGTSSRTKSNALDLMKHLKVESREVDIRALCLAEMQALKHKPFGIDIARLSLEQFVESLHELPAGSQDLVFENVQARMRTSILMNAGFVVGTGDLSELALGWCTYNADHMSMYNPNASIPKTLVKFLVDWVADHQFEGTSRETLKDIVDTEISPELLPATRDGKITQKTESSVGPYELNDFFLFHILRYGMSAEKILYLAKQARFDKNYTAQEIRYWLKLFLQRFFKNQFKRSCLPDGPKVGSVSLSPRGDWRMPSDASANAWIAWIEQEEKMEATQPRKRALLLVDPLNGFGSSSHNDGKGHYAEFVGPPIGELQDKGNYDYCCAGVDQHPVDMFNFASQCPGKTPYQDKVTDRDGEPAVIYPDHCQKGSWSADFLPGVRRDLIQEIFPKGPDRDKDSHSACGNQSLIPRLKELGITDVDIVGLVYRICVGFTAIDLAKAGFRVRVVADCTRDLAVPEFEHVIHEMANLGVEIVNKNDVLNSHQAMAKSAKN